MILLLLCLQILPEREFFIYETNDLVKIGKIEVTMHLDCLFPNNNLYLTIKPKVPEDIDFVTHGFSVK